jgi:hypothetical protein
MGESEQGARHHPVRAAGKGGTIKAIVERVSPRVATVQGQDRRSDAAMEAEPDGYGVLPTLVRLLAGARFDVQG